MTKTELIRAVAENCGVKQSVAADVIGNAITTIMSAVAVGDSVAVPGFGTFESRNHEARTARNPQTGESIEIPAHRVPAFKAGKIFKELCK